jgi:hypothetical protein
LFPGEVIFFARSEKRRAQIRSAVAALLRKAKGAMSVHVKNGTPMHGPSLCDTCSQAHIVRGYRATEMLTMCAANYPVHRVAFPVQECTSYIDKNRQNLCEMERMAWILAPRGPKRKAGFVHASELMNEDGEIELKLDDSE